MRVDTALKKLLRGQRGQGLTEFALVLPLLIVTLLGIIDFGRLFYLQSEVTNAAREGARRAMIAPTDCTSIEAATKGILILTPPDDVTINITYVDDATESDLGDCASAPSVTNGDRVVIETDYTATLLTPVLSGMFPPLPLTGSSVRTIVADSLNVADTDSDSDGLGDSWENTYFGDLDEDGTGDPDTDSCDNECEETHGTDPNNPDTDGDGDTDGDEVTNGTDPNDPLDPGGGADSDSDGLVDAWEMLHFGDLDEDGSGDPDGDTCDNACEESYGTDPNDTDTDGDGMPDIWEITYLPPMDPTANDALGDGDNDGTSNGDEYAGGSDPGDATDPTPPDDDTDGLNDIWEMTFFGDLDEIGTGDPDSDACQNSCEQTNNIDPTVDDSDTDGMPDGWEIVYGLAPAVNDAASDADVDTVTNLSEYGLGMNPTSTDTDSDAMADGWEVGYMPSLDPTANDAAGDADGDGVTNLDEYLGGTDPTDPDDPGGPAGAPVLTFDAAVCTHHTFSSGVALSWTDVGASTYTLYRNGSTDGSLYSGGGLSCYGWTDGPYECDDVFKKNTGTYSYYIDADGVASNTVTVNSHFGTCAEVP